MDEQLTLDTLIAKIKDKDDKVRAAAWQAAGKVGAPALAPLAAVAKDGELEVSRAANRAMWQVVRYSGRPGADAERKATVAALIEVFTDEQLPVQLRRDVVWMLSEVITNDEYDPAQAAEQFKNPDFRDDLRMALQRIPGDNAVAALKAGLEIVPDDFKPAIACSLRARGVEVPNVPCVKLKPTKQTKVKPVGR
jgi:HEAT repeat protein